MSDEEQVDVLIDPEEELEQFKAVPVALSKEGEQLWIQEQAYWRARDHEAWQARETNRVDNFNEHIKTTNRFNLINSVVHFAGLAAIIGILVTVLR